MNEIASVVLQQLGGGGEWFMFPKTFLKKLNLRSALVMSYLISRYNIQKQTGFKYDQWILAQSQFMSKELSCSISAVDKCVQELTRLDWISKATKGLPGKRHILIHWHVITEDIYQDTGSAKSTTLGSAKSTTHINPKGFIKKKKRKRTVDRRAVNRSCNGFGLDENKSPLSNNEVQISDMLMDIARKDKKKVSWQKKNQVSNFKKLWKLTTFEEVSSFLKWYAKFSIIQKRKVKLHSIYSPKHLVDKWESASIRWKEELDNDPNSIQLSERQLKWFDSIKDRLSCVEWPDENSLDRSIKKSIINLSLILDALDWYYLETVDQCDNEDDYLTYIESIKASASPVKVICATFQELHGFIKDHSTWSGNMDKHVITEQSEMLVRLGSKSHVRVLKKALKLLKNKDIENACG